MRAPPDGGPKLGESVPRSKVHEANCPAWRRAVWHRGTQAAVGTRHGLHRAVADREGVTLHQNDAVTHFDCDGSRYNFRWFWSGSCTFGAASAVGYSCDECHSRYPASAVGWWGESEKSPAGSLSSSNLDAYRYGPEDPCYVAVLSSKN